MLALDGGACPSTWRLRALARRALGDEAGALEACRAEIDSAAYPTLAFLSAPQAGTLARDLLREACRRHGFVPVDLPAIFAEHTGSRLPGRRLFFDYCHLTLEGIRGGDGGGGGRGAPVVRDDRGRAGLARAPRLHAGTADRS